MWTRALDYWFHHGQWSNKVPDTEGYKLLMKLKLIKATRKMGQIKIWWQIARNPLLRRAYKLLMKLNILCSFGITNTYKFKPFNQQNQRKKKEKKIWQRQNIQIPEPYPLYLHNLPLIFLFVAYLFNHTRCFSWATNRVKRCLLLRPKTMACLCNCQNTFYMKLDTSKLSIFA